MQVNSTSPSFTMHLVSLNDALVSLNDALVSLNDALGCK